MQVGAAALKRVGVTQSEAEGNGMAHGLVEVLSTMLHCSLHVEWLHKLQWPLRCTCWPLHCAGRYTALAAALQWPLCCTSCCTQDAIVELVLAHLSAAGVRLPHDAGAHVCVRLHDAGKAKQDEDQANDDAPPPPVECLGEEEARHKAEEELRCKAEEELQLKAKIEKQRQIALARLAERKADVEARHEADDEVPANDEVQRHADDAAAPHVPMRLCSKLTGVMIQNGGNTCYMDSVLFAMFATASQFTSMLTCPLPDGPSRKMQTAIRERFCDKLESGCTRIVAHEMNVLRKFCREAG